MRRADETGNKPPLKGSATQGLASNSTNDAFSGSCELRQMAHLTRVAAVAKGLKPYPSQHPASYAGLVLSPADASSFLAPEGAILRSWRASALRVPPRLMGLQELPHVGCVMRHDVRLRGVAQRRGDKRGIVLQAQYGKSHHAALLPRYDLI